MTRAIKTPQFVLSIILMEVILHSGLPRETQIMIFAVLWGVMWSMVLVFWLWIYYKSKAMHVIVSRMLGLIVVTAIAQLGRLAGLFSPKIAQSMDFQIGLFFIILFVIFWGSWDLWVSSSKSPANLAGNRHEKPSDE